MAAAIKALNAKIRQNKALDYLCSTRTSRYPICFLWLLDMPFLGDLFSSWPKIREQWHAKADLMMGQGAHSLFCYS